MTVQTITPVQAEGFYNSILDKIRDRRDRFGESWEEATALALRQVGDGEAVVVFAHLRKQWALSSTDVILVNALARRLGLKIEWKSTVLA